MSPVPSCAEATDACGAREVQSFVATAERSRRAAGSAAPARPLHVLEELAGRHLQRLGDLVEDDHRRVAHAALDAAM